MNGTELETFCDEIDSGASIGSSVLFQFINLAKAIVEQMRPWMLLRHTDTSATVAAGNTWQTVIDLSGIARLSRFYGDTPIKLFDGANGMQYFAQVPFDKRLEYRNAPGGNPELDASAVGLLCGCHQQRRRGLTTSTRGWCPEHKPMRSSSASRRNNEKQLHPSFLPTARCRNKDYDGSMAGDERICPKCRTDEPAPARVLADESLHPRPCPNCGVPLEPPKRRRTKRTARSRSRKIMKNQRLDSMFTVRSYSADLLQTSLPMPDLSYLRSEIDRMRRQMVRQRKDIKSLQRAGISTKAAEELLERMLAKVDSLCAERDRQVKEQRIKYPGTNKAINGPIERRFR